MNKQNLFSEDLKWLSILHYTRLPLVFGAMAMALSTSQILFSIIYWQPIVFVGLSTYIVYTIDNLVDWVHERDMLASIKPIFNIYLICCAFSLPVCIVILLYLLGQGGEKFSSSLLVLGVISGILIYLSRRPQKYLGLATYYWIERLLVTLTWALVAVLVPLLYSQFEFSLQVYLAIIFIWMLCWVIGVVWRFTSSLALQPLEARRLTSSQLRVIQIMTIVSLTALLQVVVDTFLGFFPPIHLTVATLPVICILFLQQWEKAYEIPLKYCNLLIGSLTVALLSLTFAHFIL